MNLSPAKPAAQAVAILVLDERGDLLAAYGRRAGYGTAGKAQPDLKDWLPQADDREHAQWLALRDSLLQDVAGNCVHRTIHTDSLHAQIEQSGCAVSNLPDSACAALVVWASGGFLFVEHIRSQINSSDLAVRRLFNRDAVMRRNPLETYAPVTYLRLRNTLTFYADQLGEPALAANDRYGSLNWGHNKPS